MIKNYGLSSGTSLLFLSGKILKKIVFLPGKSRLLSKYVQKEKKTSSIISSYCRRRSVPVGVPTLGTILEKIVRHLVNH